MKFKLENKSEILNILSEVEKKMEDLRFALTMLPKEFEISEVVTDREDA